MLVLFYTILICWLMMVFLCTMLHYTRRIGPKSILTDLSLIKNYNQVVSGLSKPTATGERMEDYLDGLRVFCQMYFVMIHFVLSSYARNWWLLDATIYHVAHTFWNTMVVTRLLFVLILFLSGLSTSTWFLKQFKGKSQSTATIVTKFFFTRYMSLAPVYYLFIGFYLVFVNHLFYDQHRDDQMVNECNEGVLRMMTFVSNLVNDNTPCIIWGWTYNVMVQLFIVTPVFALAFKRSLNRGITVTVIGIVTFCCINFYVIFKYKITGFFILAEDSPREIVMSLIMATGGYTKEVHSKPYVHAPAYLLGMLFGYAIQVKDVDRLFQSEAYKSAVKLAKIVFVANLAISFAHNTVIPPMLWFNAFETSVHPILTSLILSNFIYNLPKTESFARPLLLSPLASVLKPCLRISYLMHIIVILVFFGHIRVMEWTLTIGTALTLVFNAILVVIVNYIVAFVLTLLVDLPVTNLCNKLTHLVFN